MTAGCGALVAAALTVVALSGAASGCGGPSPRESPLTAPQAPAPAPQRPPGPREETEAPRARAPIQVGFQTPHAQDVWFTTISPDGLRAASGGSRGDLYVWDLPSRRKVRALDGHVGMILRGAFLSSDTLHGEPRRRLVTCGRDEQTILWDADQGERLLTWQAGPTRSLAAQPSGAFVLAGGADGKIRKLEPGRAEPSLTLDGHAGAVTELAFHPDGARFASGGEDGRVLLWDLRSGTAPVGILPGHESLGPDVARLRSIALHPDGRRVATLDGRGQLRTWDTMRSRTEMAGGRSVRVLAPAPLDLAGGGLGPNAIAYSQDGKELIASVGIGRLVRLSLTPPGARREVAAGRRPIRHLTFLPDGRRIVTEDFGGTLAIIDLETGTCDTIPTVQTLTTNAHLSPDGRRVYGAGTLVAAWNLSEARLEWRWTSRRYAEGDSSETFVVAPSPDGKELLVGGSKGTLALLDAATGRPVRRSELAASVEALAFSGDGRAYLALGSTDEIVYSTPPRLTTTLSVERFDRATGRSLGKRSFPPIAGGVCPPGISPDLRRAVAGGSGRAGKGALHILDLEAATISTRAGFIDGWTKSATFSPDGALLATAGTDGVVRLLRADALEPVRTLRPDDASSHLGRDAAEWNNLLPLAFSADGKRLVLGSAFGFAHIWEVGTGAALARVGGHRDSVNAIALSGDGTTLVTADFGLARVTRLPGAPGAAEAPAPLASMLLHPAGWIVFTDDGYFDASTGGAWPVSIVQGGRVFAIDQLALRYNRPDILIERLGRGDPAAIADFRAQAERRRRRAGIGSDGAESAIELRAPEARIASARRSGAKVALEATFTAPPGAAVASWQVWVNDVPLFGPEGKAIAAGAGGEVTTEVALTPGKNKIEVACKSDAGIESLRAATEETLPGEAPADLVVLAIGVSKYRAPGLDLAFAEKDALDLAAALGAAKGRGFRDVRVKTILNEQATAAAIREAAAFVAAARPADTLVLFVAGHGLHDGDAAATYYYLTHDADPARLPETAASFETIEGLLYASPARRKLFLMDTCASGELDPLERAEASTAVASAGVRSRGFGPAFAKGKTAAAPAAAPGSAGGRSWLVRRDRFIFDDLVRRSGAIVLSSCKGGQLSYESAKVGNGLFTAEVLRALTTEAADADRDGKLTSRELRAHVEAAVGEATNGRQTPTVDRDNLAAEVTLPLLRGR